MPWISEIIAFLAMMFGAISCVGFVVQGKVGEAFAVPVLVAVAIFLQLIYRELRAKQ